jgi:hypothetical protein
MDWKKDRTLTFASNEYANGECLDMCNYEIYLN